MLLKFEERFPINSICVGTDKIMKLNCNTVQRLLSDYIDAVLSKQETANVDIHLKSCTVCQHEVDSLKKTRDLIVDFYIQPEVSDKYLQNFEVELHQHIENKGPTGLSQRIITSAAQSVWCLLTQVRQCFDRYGFIKRNALPMCVFLLIVVTGMVVTHLFNQNTVPPLVNHNTVHNHSPTIDPMTIDEKTDLLPGTYNERRAKRTARSDVSSSTLGENTQKEGYWKITEPVTTETEGNIIVMQVSSDRSVPSETSNSRLNVYVQPDILDRESPLQEDSYSSQPLESQVVPFSENFQPKHRRLSGFVAQVMHVPSEILAIPGLHVLSNL